MPRRKCVVCDGLFYADPGGVRRGLRRFCSNECRIRGMGMDPETYPKTSTHRGLGGKRSDLGDTYFRSSWEANWARYLNFLKQHGLVVGWSYESRTFEFTAIKKGSRFYTPDFLVVYPDGREEFDEVKGWMDPRSETKLKRMAKYYPDVKINLVDKERYSTVSRQVSGLIPHWERRLK